MQTMIIEIMNRFGYIGICFLIALENIFPPIPSEIILSFGGFMTTYTTMSTSGVIIAATLGSSIGAAVLYGFGSLLTPNRLEQLIDRKLFKLLGFKKGDITKTVVWFEKHGKTAILFGRCIPIIRSLISIPAGMSKIKFSLFMIYTFLGSIMWNILLVSLGAYLGSSWEEVLSYFESYSTLTMVILGIIFFAMWLIIIKKRVFKNKE